MTRHDLSVHIDRKKQTTTAELQAEVYVGELAGRMQEMARAVVANPQAFNGHHAHKLRNAAQLAGDAADLIDMERIK